MKKKWISTITFFSFFLFASPNIYVNFEMLNLEKSILNSYANNPWIEVISPNGGEIWSKNQTIIWQWGGEIPILPVYFNILYRKI